MKAVGITFMLWGLGIFIISIIVAWFAVRFFWTARKIEKEMELAAKKADARLRMRYNRIATLEVPDLHAYLTNMFSRCLEMVSDQEISRTDPDAEVTLYTLAVEQLMIYLGPETIAAIEYYYGEGYLDRWSKTNYKLLNKRGMVKEIINNKTMRSEAIQREFK